VKQANSPFNLVEYIDNDKIYNCEGNCIYPKRLRKRNQKKAGVASQKN
jgi:hypothetical protein